MEPNRTRVLPSSLPHTRPWASSAAHSTALQAWLHNSTQLLPLSACPQPLLFCSPPLLWTLSTTRPQTGVQTVLPRPVPKTNQLHHAGLLQLLLFISFCHFSRSRYHQSEPQTEDMQKNSSWLFFFLHSHPLEFLPAMLFQKSSSPNPISFACHPHQL